MRLSSLTRSGIQLSAYKLTDMPTSILLPKVLITLPVYNEEAILAQHTELLHAYCVQALPDVAWEILIADNGSSDTSPALCTTLSSRLPHVIFERTAIPGRGGALKQAWLSHEADVYLYMDIDLATDIQHLPLLISKILSEKYDVATGSRLISGAHTRRSYFRTLCSILYNRLPVFFFPSFPVRDAQCGFKAISRRVRDTLLRDVQDTGWFFDTELLIRAHLKGYKISEFPVLWRDQRFVQRKSKVRILETGLTNIKKLFQLKRSL